MSVNFLIPIFLNCLSSFFIFVAKSHLAFFCKMILIIVLKNTFYIYTSACTRAVCVVTQVRFSPPKKSCVRVSFNINFCFFSVCFFISVIPKVVVDMWHIHALLEGMLHSDSQVNFRRWSSASQAIQFNKTSLMHFTGTFTNISNSNRGIHYTKRR